MTEPRMVHRLRSLLLASTVSAALLSPVPATAATLRGHVVSGTTPLPSLLVALYATDPSHPDRCAGVLGAAPTRHDGSFELSYTPPSDVDAVLYVIADGRSAPDRLDRLGKCRPFAGPVVLASVLGTAGPAPVSTDVVVNERTTVASAYALARFIDGAKIGGKAKGLQNAAGMVQNLANPATGAVGAVLATPPNGNQTETLGSFNSLANMVAACVASPGACTTLFDLARPPRGSTPTDTLQAMVDIARHPATSAEAVQSLFALSQTPPAPYQPARPADSPPAAWTLALRFVGDGVSMDGPGNMAIDEAGSVWVTNNFTFSPDPAARVCGSNLLLRFTPTGQYVPGSPYAGGGLDGAGFGITIDPKGDVWVGNFGFASPDCPHTAAPRQRLEVRAGRHAGQSHRLHAGRDRLAPGNGLRPAGQHLDRQLRERHTDQVSGRRPDCGGPVRHRSGLRNPERVRAAVRHRVQSARLGLRYAERRGAASRSCDPMAGRPVRPSAACSIGRSGSPRTVGATCGWRTRHPSMFRVPRARATPMPSTARSR